MGSSTYEQFAQLVCPEHGDVPLTREQYDFQMDRPDARWSCTKVLDNGDVCGKVCNFDDDYFEAKNPEPQVEVTPQGST